MADALAVAICHAFRSGCRGMLDYLKGKVVETGEEDWVVEANGFCQPESPPFVSRGYWRRKCLLCGFMRENGEFTLMDLMKGRGQFLTSCRKSEVLVTVLL